LIPLHLLCSCISCCCYFIAFVWLHLFCCASAAAAIAFDSAESVTSRRSLHCQLRLPLLRQLLLLLLHLFLAGAFVVASAAAAAIVFDLAASALVVASSAAAAIALIPLYRLL
jgi:tryptophan-rich sensory protein